MTARRRNAAQRRHARSPRAVSTRSLHARSPRAVSTCGLHARSVVPAKAGTQCRSLKRARTRFHVGPSFPRKREPSVVRPKRATTHSVVPADAGTQCRSRKRHWVPAFAGTTRPGTSLTPLGPRLRGDDGARGTGTRHRIPHSRGRRRLHGAANVHMLLFACICPQFPIPLHPRRARGRRPPLPAPAGGFVARPAR
jgi:hypothetical protein